MTVDRSESGYATLLDGLLFLALVSVGAALVANTLPGTAGLKAAGELRSQRLDAAALESLLASRDADGRTVGERVGGALLARMAGSGGTDPGLESAVNDTLARALGPRYRFNLTVVWRPVPWAGPEARIAVGPAVPQRATLVERGVGLPTGDGFREVAEEEVKPELGERHILDAAIRATQMSLARVRIVYCEPCGYNSTALAIEQDLARRLRTTVRVSLEPAKEDVFDVWVNERPVFTKAGKGRLPEPEEEIPLLPETWEVYPDLRALAEQAVASRLRGPGDADVHREAKSWLEEQLRPNRARAVLAIWQR